MEVTAFERLEQKIEHVLGKMEAQTEEIAELKNRLSEKENTISDLELQLEEMKQQKSEVRGRIEMLVQKLETSL
ncbi:cell division protein ZapB [Dethiosulfatarculus sandiegensis]|uniref:Cell division protein ZapB n=1 Tax=Dethiosulfatarculus sandiegensis TaxID=1429043 RepID=A0A0D2GII6_9BACT|nr:cell division protein ZapB [Dethiosulfatarculus sandiegensis]KIX14627.1 hypothetical protein X474_07735 [Dethiosulfatarculus sandiegensis]